MSDMHHHDDSESTPVEYAKFIGVIAFIVGITWFAYSRSDLSGADEFMRIFMGIFLTVFAGFKFAGYKMFVMMFQGYDLIAKRSQLYARAYPFIEQLLGAAFLLDILPTPRNIVLLMIMGIGSVGVFYEIKHRRSGVYCACLGNIIKLPLSTVSLVENLTMVAMASAMLAGIV